tara:strand:- start:1416 stop:1760 length:345 start_codon:yes stop_codon:yes gene_type:complete
MSLDVYLMVPQPTYVYESNITHNLGAMAREVKLSNGMTLYAVLWRPDEQEGLRYAKDISELLDEGYNILLSDLERFKQFDPENGWGSYEGLCNFVYYYRNACWDNPDTEIKVSR